MQDYRNVKICNAKQAKQKYQYKNIKTKLYTNNVAIWYNKTCRIKSFFSICALNGHLLRVTIPDSVLIQFDFLRMCTILLETCRVL
jgi:hypothetical protein